MKISALFDKKMGNFITGGLVVALIAVGYFSSAHDKNSTQPPSAEEIEARSELQTILAAQLPMPKAEEVSQDEGGLGTGNLPSMPANTIEALCGNDETQFLEIQKTLLHSWKTTWMNKNVSAFAKLLKSDSKTLDLAGAKRDFYRTDGVITEMKWTPRLDAVVSDISVITKNMKTYLSNFREIKDISLSTFQVKSDRTERFPDLSMRMARLNVKFDLRAVDKANMRREDRGSLEVWVERASATDTNWKITNISGFGFETLVAANPAYREITQNTGLDQIPTYLRTEAIRRGGYAMAVADFDGDGKPDMYVGTKGEGVLLKGDGKGHFTPVKNSGIESHTLVKSAIFADFSNSGRQDLLLVRFAPESGAVLDPNARGEFRRNDLILYRNLGNGKFKRDDSIYSGEKTGQAMPAAVADFNKDGYLDVYAGFPGARDFTTLADADGPAADVRVQGLFMNQGGKSFKMAESHVMHSQDFTEKSSRQKLYPHSAVAFDFNQDGNPDIMVIDDRGNLSPAYQGKGDGTFYQVNENIGVSNNGYGMSTAAMDFDNDGKIDMMISNVGFLAMKRMNNSCRANWRMVPFERMARNSDLRLYKGLGSGHFTEVTSAAGLDWTGDGLAGIEFIDFNHDGRPDIFVSNGLWSGTDETQDMSSLFVRTRRFMVDKALDTVHDRTQSAVMDVLANFRGDIYSGKPGTTRPGMGGYQRKQLYRNDGDGRFTEVGYLAGVDSIADGYTVAKADLTGHGLTDLVLRNGDPGSAEVKYSPVQIFENLNPYHNKALLIRLEGRKSNRDGIGAEVTVKANGMTQLQQMIANNGTVQSEKVLIFGLAKADQADEVTVKWPSGRIQHLQNVPAGKILIQEGNEQNKLAVQ